MSHKFSIVIEVKPDGSPITTGYNKTDAQKANQHFVRLRESGVEAYFFQHPVADRRCKSEAQKIATLGERDADGKVHSPVSDGPGIKNISVDNTIVMPTRMRRGNTIKGISSPDAVDIK